MSDFFQSIMSNEIVAYWLRNAWADVSRYVLFALGVWFILWVVLAKTLKDRKIRMNTPPWRQMLTEFLFSIRSIAVFSTVGLLTWLLDKAGLMWGPPVAETLGPAWGAVTFLGLIVGHDAWFYWTHRTIHHPKLFRRFHRRHHKSNNPSPFTAYSFDIGEAAIQSVFVTIWALLIPTQWEVVSLYVVFQIARNTIGHCGYELFPAKKDGTPLFDWLTTVTHHARAGYNFGFYFTFWDRLMGTEDPTYHQRFAQVVNQQTNRVRAEVAVA
jgi:sterol desaturase/sphingolipid hydroxylase (fatty acid hydroxylase superfamily)